ncbi:hypothetical protein BB427_16245 [Pseudoalteromonas sp. BMB]|uniref:hypothetical protein n=1 Tax=Pseudoalteromonas sp. BMB TaxID=1874619 RepID=UPI00083D2608|nr:hypothetical protein [Pseudoalteromonas sp. BMB]ODB35858.1 hypothetical protein BB427_16245 [Pseudoalteromonas sp. BMB]
MSNQKELLEQLRTKLNISDEDELSLASEFFLEGYKLGRKDGYEGIHMSPINALHYFNKSINMERQKYN